MATEKTPIIQRLYERYQQGELPDGVVRQDDITAAIKETGVTLSKDNPANFFKDIVRKQSANDHWPPALIEAGVTARQRYHKKRVFQFVPFQPSQMAPFPDLFPPGPTTAIHQVQSASVPFAARQLGRKEESWLMQIVVALRLVETQLSLFSPARARLRDITHLQMSMKTKPEIDGVFLVNYASSRILWVGSDVFFIVTCEAKQLGERILDDQIREQVAQAFKQTEKLTRPLVRCVKPMAVQVRNIIEPQGTLRAIYVVEFAQITRKAFNAKYRNTTEDDERIYDLPLKAVSSTLYQLTPAVAGINAG